MKALKNHVLIACQSVVATLWSLYYWFYWDPFINFQTWYFFNSLNALSPCTLCRYARILMYPIVVLSVVGIIRKKKEYIYPTMVLSTIWLWLEIYHYALQKFDIQTSQFCTMNNPCNALEVNYLWFITIPFLCWVAFLVILINCIIIHKKHKKKKTT